MYVCIFVYLPDTLHMLVRLRSNSWCRRSAYNTATDLSRYSTPTICMNDDSSSPSWKSEASKSWKNVYLSRFGFDSSLSSIVGRILIDRPFMKEVHISPFIENKESLYHLGLCKRCHLLFLFLVLPVVVGDRLTPKKWSVSYFLMADLRLLFADSSRIVVSIRLAS